MAVPPCGDTVTAPAVVFLIIGLVELAVGICLFNMERWAWVLTVLVVWVDLVFDIMAAIIKAQTFGAVLLSIVIPVIVLIYMYQGGVRKSFE